MENISLIFNQFKNFIKKISKLLIIRTIANIKFLDSAINYSKGIGYQGSLKSEFNLKFFCTKSKTLIRKFLIPK